MGRSGGVPNSTPQSRKAERLARELTVMERVGRIKTMAEWAKLGATRHTREKIAKKLRGKG